MNREELEKKIKKQEEQIIWLKEMTKDVEDSLFCNRLELKKKDDADYFSI
tara:strand:- start:72 stop:221 length:150 start_codon:yes stop_codon:yes gene_type:complete